MEVQLVIGKRFDVEKRRISLFGEIDDLAAYSVIHGLSEMDPTMGVEIILSSGGGSESAGFSIYDAIMAFPGHVTINCYGSCMSIAAAVLQAADLRILQPNCDILVHGGSIEMPGSDSVMQQRDVIDLAQVLVKGNERYMRCLQERSGQPLSVIHGWCQGETLFSAKEAVALGLADMVAQSTKTFSPPKKKRRKKSA